MLDKELEKKEKPKELIRVERLIDEGKHDEALQLIKHFEEKEERTLYEIGSCNLLKCELFFQQGLYENVVKLTQQTYKKSLDLGNNVLSFNAFLIMAEAFIYLWELEKAAKIIEQGEELLKILSQELPKNNPQREASMVYVKGWFYDRNNNFDLALLHYERVLALREKIGATKEVCKSLLKLGWRIGIGGGELDRALEYVNQGLVIAKENNWKYYIANGFKNIAGIYHFKGDLDRCILFNEQSLTIFKELNNKERMAMLLNNMGDSYRKKGELDRALECLEQSLALCNKLGNLQYKAGIYSFLIQILVEKGDLKQAQQRLLEWKPMKDKLGNKILNLEYLLTKALILKSSSQTRNRDKAEEILRLLLEDEDTIYEFAILSLLHLCELLLIKLSNTGNLKVLDEIHDYVNQIRNAAKNSHSYWLQAETYLLQAKLKLIMFEFEETQRLLTQAAHIAEKYNQNLLTKQISEEQEKLFKKLNKWEELKQSKAKITTRIELAGLEKQIRRLLKKRMGLGKSK
ncbi:MAG: tetratricopeptide repeat protein [Promethearchaeota archaeon]|jgi:tetratricopeptide (TPR) repeat protein